MMMMMMMMMMTIQKEVSRMAGTPQQLKVR